MCIVVLMLEYFAYHNGPLVWAANIMPGFFAACLLYQYFLVVSLMTVNFNRVNRAIRSLSSDLSDDFPKSGICCRRILPKYTIVQGIRHLRNIHDNLCDICDVISEFYSFPILFVVIFTFHSLLFNSYYLFQPLVLYNRGLDIAPFIDTVLLIAFPMYPFGLLAAKTTDVLNEIGRTAIVVHSFLKNATDQETRSELKQFSLQLLNRQIKFTACGYFNMDNSLFQSVISSVVTYLVILLQFQAGNSEHVCQCNCTAP
ncbi:putative gustatory receptor 28a [Megalopta genalis]|uniref:putative gustatory receptor 28a n=1 Tax=Megalopta genalis TaxID=115081 RepID=UPI003FD55BC1